jgi:uncharacterized protein (UPF0276 family)
VFLKSSCEIASLSPGVGLRTAHIGEILEHRPDIGWLEVHPDNYMADPTALALLERVRKHYPLSLHGVGLSLGTAGPLNRRYVGRLKSLIERLEPFLVSEHLAWSMIDDAHLNDLLPLPYTEEALEVMTSHVQQVQAAIGRRILIENPASYLRFRHSTMSEAAFLKELTHSTGCGLLFDVNNLYVSAHNVGLNPVDYFAALPGSAICEFHLAGHAMKTLGGDTVLIDDHGSRVSDDVWALFAEAIRRFGYRPTLVEWDTELPALDVLLGEARRAKTLSENLAGERDVVTP